MAVLVGKPAPEFKAEAVVKGEFTEISLSDYLGSYVVLFFYPLDFTFVCPTELHAFQDKLGEFQKRGAVVLGCSVDSKFSHWAWLNTPKKEGGIAGVEYPLLADLTKSIARDYDVLAGDAVAFRGLFLIDKAGVVRHQVVNDLPLGRNVDEALRMVDALKHVEEFGEVCPANWVEGKDAMKATADGVAEYLSAH